MDGPTGESPLFHSENYAYLCVNHIGLYYPVGIQMLSVNVNRWKCLSGSGLKLLAVLFMLIDHLAAFYLYDVPALQVPFLHILHKTLTPYMLMRLIGRMSFPIFAFLLVEGFIHTHDRKRYGLNLLLFALLSEIPWNLVHFGTWHYLSQNIFFTLLLGYLGLCAIESYRNDSLRLLASLLALLAASVLLRVDYGCAGYGFILMLYILRDNKVLQAIVGSCMLSSTWKAGLAFIPISMYNGQRGFVKGPLTKYAFYLFYPLHLLLIYWLRFGKN